MRRVLNLIRVAILAGANSCRYVFDVKIVLMVIKGSITAFIVSWILSKFSGLFGNKWIGNYLELIHDVFALIAFTISCILDLKRYWLANHKGKQKSRKINH
jgi:hypothetical protein